ncbi:DUF4256 domain-containing protein [Sphingobacterium humi]|uniref:DUF4256 family protein n=1 Tax=Sphingobacterium humi TaxID=1796905 RepID=A0A6N8L6F3_9SPHI|nr:DUF4256 domain-containing protein [Sphingobacterium humi]MVZ64041.1 DUF4256 family protein [Sphingobacterium humi]
MKKKKLSIEQCAGLLEVLQKRFEKHIERHPDLQWTAVQAKLEAHPDKLASLMEMEQTEGEPDVLFYNKETDEYGFVDCAAESPKGRRSLCYDAEALASRKEHKPKNSAVAVAEAMGASLLDEAQYQQLQETGKYDLKTSSWLKTPDAVRTLGGALFGDRRYNRVFTYHNGAESYYAARGFRVLLTV